MPVSKQAVSTAALKKVKKNVRKQFEGNDATELYRILSKRLFQNVIQVFDILNQADRLIPDEDVDLVGHVMSATESLHNGPLAVDPLDVEANELIQIFSSPVWKSFIEAYTEIATKHYYMPDLPDITFAVSGLGAYGTMASLIASRNSNMMLNGKSLTDGLANNRGIANSSDQYASRSLIYGTSGGVGGTGGYIELRKKGATLTGGGTGTALPPVDGAVKMVGIQKAEGEDLGITVTQQRYMSAHYGLVKELVIKRILAASRIEQLGLLHEGDVIREANGIPVDNPEVLQKILRNASGEVIFKIIPGYQSAPITTQLFVRAHFSYNPKHDNLIPCKEAGLAFSTGDILQVLNQEDPYWWQARHYKKQERAGLIPSVVLQERRKAFVQSAPNPEELTYKMFACGLARRRKKKVIIPFCAREADNYETKDIVLYEEVALVSGFQRPVVCLIAAPGVGRRTLKNMLLRIHPERYATPVAYTSKEPEPGEDDRDFVVESRAKMEADNLKNRYFEFGELDGDYYGSKYESIRQIVKDGRTCLLDCSVYAVQRLRNSEFMPYVVFLAAASVSCMKAMYEYGMSMGFTEKWKRDEVFRSTLEESCYIERNYRHLIDYILLCDNIEATFEQLNQKLEEILIQPQWVPARWLY